MQKIGIMAAVAVAAFCGLTQAATQNYIQGYDVQTISVNIAGQRTATVTPWKQVLPYPAKLIGATYYCRASGGTSPTLTMDLKMDGTSVQSAATSITADTAATASLATTALTDESTLSLVMTIGGTNPTWDDCSALFTLIRK